VGLALLVVLERLAPAERVAFVLHDAFDLSFDEIAPIVGRSPAAARQLASRARRRIRGGDPDVRPAADSERLRQRAVVDAYLAASRAGDFEALLAVHDPDVALRVDAAAAPNGVAIALRGARAVAGGALAFGARARHARPALIDGAVGLIVAPNGRLLVVLRLTVDGDRVVAVEVIADPARLAALELAVLDPSA
jgi:RNA polymerase sigma-70 factor (ECF subfamily)